MKLDHSGGRVQTFFGILTLVIGLSVAGPVWGQPAGYSTSAIDVADFSFAPSVIDSTNSSQTVTMRARITTSERDFWLMHATLNSPVNGYMFGFESQDRISGTARDGIYQKTFTFPQYSHAGTWVVSTIHVNDGTSAYYRWRAFDTNFLAARGFPTQLQVINNNEAVPPEITDFDFTPTSVGGASRTVMMTLRARDVASGVTSVGGYFLYPADCYVYDEPCDSFSFDLTPADRISGDDRDGVYRIAIDVPLTVPPGTYYASLVAFDGVRNITRLRSSDIAARGYPSQLTLAAAPFVGISGRVLTPSGSGLRNASVTLTNAQGVTRTATTSSFGSYYFDNVETGLSYTIAVSSKRYRFQSTVLKHVNSSLAYIDFAGLE